MAERLGKKKTEDLGSGWFLLPDKFRLWPFFGGHVKNIDVQGDEKKEKSISTIEFKFNKTASIRAKP